MTKRALLLALTCSLALGGCSYMPSWMGGVMNPSDIAEPKAPKVW